MFTVHVPKTRHTSQPCTTEVEVNFSLLVVKVRAQLSHICRYTKEYYSRHDEKKKISQLTSHKKNYFFLKNVYFPNKALSLATLAARYIIPKPSSLGSTMMHLMLLYPPTITLGAKKKRLRKKGKGHTHIPKKKRTCPIAPTRFQAWGPSLYSDTYVRSKAFESHFSF